MEIIKQIPLLNKTNSLYTGGDFVFNKYYFTIPTLNSIYVYSFFPIEKRMVSTEKSYNSLTYDNCKKNFYVSSDTINNRLYILDKHFNEIDSIQLVVPNKYLGDIKNISYYEEKQKILITTNYNVYSVTKEGYFIKEEIEPPVTCRKQGLEQTDQECNKCPPPKIYTNGVIFTACSYFCDTKYIAYVKNNAAYLAKVSSSGTIIEIIFVDDNIIINDILNVEGKLHLLITKKCSYNYIYITNIKCHKCFPDHEKNCKQSGVEILNSVAKVEKSIASVLNNESEKLRKILEKTNNQNDILKVNESVTKTIQKITLLENILLQKTELAVSLCKKKKRKKKAIF